MLWNIALSNVLVNQQMEKPKEESELSIIQKTFDLIIWYVPIINRLPRTHQYRLGARIIDNLYDFYEGLLKARYKTEKLEILEPLNSQLDILRHETRMLEKMKLIPKYRYENAGKIINEIGAELGGWIKQQRRR